MTCNGAAPVLWLVRSPERASGSQGNTAASRARGREICASSATRPPEVTIGEVLARATADRRAADRRQLALMGAAIWTGPERRMNDDRRIEAPSWAVAG